MYNVFGLGASHSINAQYMAQLALANRGRKVCLIQGAGTQMVFWFYAMMHLTCLQQPLKATIHQHKFLDLTLTTSAKGAVQDKGQKLLEVRVHPTLCRVSCTQSSLVL